MIEKEWTVLVGKGTKMWTRTNCIHHWNVKESICLFKEQGLYSVVVDLSGPMFTGKLYGPVLYLSLEEAQAGSEKIVGQIQDIRQEAV